VSGEAVGVDPLHSWARRRDGGVEVRLALLGDPGTAVGEVEVRLRARSRRITAHGTTSATGIVAFTVPDEGLARRAWRLALRPVGAPSEAGVTRLRARLLAPPGRPVALLTGPEPSPSIPPPCPRRRGGSPSRPRPVRQAVRRVARRARAVASRARRAAPAPDASSKGKPAPDRPPPAAMAEEASLAPTPPGAPRTRPGRAAGRARFRRDGTLQAPLKLLDRSRWEQALVVAGPGSEDVVASWASRLAPARVSVWSVDSGGRDALLEHLKRLGELDVVVCAVADTPVPGVAGDGLGTAGDVLFTVFPYLRTGGAFLQDRLGAGDEPLPAWLRDVAVTPDRETRRHAQARPAEVRDSFGTLVTTPDLIAVTNGRSYYYKLREDEVPDLLAVREPTLEAAVVCTRPEGSTTVAAPEIPHGPRRGAPFPDVLRHPEMRLRRYRGDVSSGGGMLLFSGRTILPESFRWPTASMLENSRALSSDEVARIRGRWVPEESLPGAYFHLDGAYSGHFGHFATETVSRLWAWDEAKRQAPDLKAFVHVRPDDPGQGRLERGFLRAYGIADVDIVTVDRPVVLHEVFGASPMWQNSTPYYAHPDLRAVWERITDGMLREVDPSEVGRHERIFVSRSAEYSHRRGCRNAAEVESLFVDHGFHVFCPEELTLLEQAALFAGARVVAGYGGSAMANLMHCRRLEALVSLSHHGYTARGEHLSMSLLGGDFHYFWAESDVAPPEEGRTLESFRSSWELDLATYGDELRAVLASY
jgi:capsular polysaccharide biosynthesis protein